LLSAAERSLASSWKFQPAIQRTLQTTRSLPSALLHHAKVRLNATSSLPQFFIASSPCRQSRCSTYGLATRFTQPLLMLAVEMNGASRDHWAAILRPDPSTLKPPGPATL